MLLFKNLTKAFSIILALSFFSAQAAPLKISILQNIEHPALDATREGLLEELPKLGYTDLVVDYQSAQGNAALAAQIAQKFASNSPDVIIAVGTKAAQAAMAATKESKIPIVFASVTDPLAAKLVTSLEAPTENVTGVSNFVAPEPQFKFFKKCLPRLKKLGIVYDPGEPNSIALNTMMDKAAKELGLELVYAIATKTSDVFAASQSLCGKVDALFVNNDNTALSAFKSVVKAAQSCGIPAFVSDVDIVDQGALAALGPDQKDLGRQAARIVDKILKNPKAPFPAVQFPEKTEEVVQTP
ncbi:MAG: ABC transporter substrate-binding protein [Alphaproteobacteria bacterium]|nr:ABC transporter substrate-binding protein [Alphaproteobacteria bacterium]